MQKRRWGEKESTISLLPPTQVSSRRRRGRFFADRIQIDVRRYNKQVRGEGLAAGFLRDISLLLLQYVEAKVWNEERERENKGKKVREAAFRKEKGAFYFFYFPPTTPTYMKEKKWLVGKRGLLRCWEKPEVEKLKSIIVTFCSFPPFSFLP